MRQTAKDMIFIKAEEALNERPLVSDALLKKCSVQSRYASKTKHCFLSSQSGMILTKAAQ